MYVSPCSLIAFTRKCAQRIEQNFKGGPCSPRPHAYAYVIYGHVMHLVAPQHQFLDALCVFDANSALTRRFLKFLGQQKVINGRKRKAFEVVPKYEGYSHIVWWLVTETAKWDGR